MEKKPTRDEYTEPLASAGLTEIEITETRVHGHAGSAIIRARKPAQ